MFGFVLDVLASAEHWVQVQHDTVVKHCQFEGSSPD